MNLTQALTKEYSGLWTSCTVRPQRRAAADAIVDRIVANKRRYAKAGKPHRVPWYVVGVIHMLEGSGNFATHLHNGDPLTARTVHVPAGRPKLGHPPFTWEVSASDALVFDGLSRWNDWSVPGALFALERFNGLGYRPLGIHTPYLWSFSNHYSKGKFVGDNHFSPSAVSQQCGAAVILKRMAERKLVKLGGPATNGAHAVDPRALRRGSKGPAVVALKTKLKSWFDATSPGEWARLRVAANDEFGLQLEKAVRLFQTRVGVEVNGIVDKATRKALTVKPV
jgi:lysozyme family protein